MTYTFSWTPAKAINEAELQAFEAQERRVYRQMARISNHAATGALLRLRRRARTRLIAQALKRAVAPLRLPREDKVCFSASDRR